MSSYLPNLCVFVGDSRTNNFDTYSQPQDLNIHYIFQRGATVDILTDLTCSFLYSHEINLDNYQVILVKLSAGINNLLHRENVLSDISPQQFIDKLLFFLSTPLAAEQLFCSFLVFSFNKCICDHMLKKQKRKQKSRVGRRSCGAQCCSL